MWRPGKGPAYPSGSQVAAGSRLGVPSSGPFPIRCSRRFNVSPSGPARVRLVVSEGFPLRAISCCALLAKASEGIKVIDGGHGHGEHQA